MITYLKTLIYVFTLQYQFNSSEYKIVYLINFCPESLFEFLLGLSQSLCAVEHIKMGEDTHHLGETVCLEDVQELKCFHLKTKAGIN